MEPLESPSSVPPEPVTHSAPEVAIPPPPDPMEGTAPSAADPGNLGSRIEKILSRTANVAETVNHYEVSVFGRESSRPQDLSLDHHFQAWNCQELDDFAGNAVYEEEEIHRLEEALAEYRLLVITGEEEIGKGSIALLLAARLSTSTQVFYSKGLGNDVAVSLERLSEKGGRCSGGLLIFRDAFVSQNQGLLRIPRELDSGQFGRLQQRLARR